jgi:hypothetical protein
MKRYFVGFSLVILTVLNGCKTTDSADLESNRSGTTVNGAMLCKIDKSKGEQLVASCESSQNSDPYFCIKSTRDGKFYGTWRRAFANAPQKPELADLSLSCEQRTSYPGYLCKNNGTNGTDSASSLDFELKAYAQIKNGNATIVLNRFDVSYSVNGKFDPEATYKCGKP